MPIQLEVSTESLLKSLSQLSLEDKRRILSLLEENIAQAEEEIFENDPKVIEEMDQARQDYQNGDYISLSDYKNSKKG